MKYQSPTIPDLLSHCGLGCQPPKAGTGVHDWIWQVAIRTKAYAADEVANYINDAVQDCGRLVPYREIHDALQNARKEKSLVTLLEQQDANPRWPKFDAELAAKHAGDSNAIERLAYLSRTDFVTLKPRGVLSQLFRRDDFVCVGTRKECAFTLPLHEILEWDRVDSMPLVVPNPMRGHEGRAQAGHASPRCNDNVARRRYLVVEFDRPEFDQVNQASLLLHLAESGAPLALVVDSGNRSLHGWFHCRGASSGQMESFMRHAVRLGADPATWTPCQFVRMPAGVRENGAQQPVLFLNPNIL